MSCMAGVVLSKTLASLHEHVGLATPGQTLLAPSTKRREVLGESHEG